MRRIAYLLHRFPAITDTFIKREIRSLQKLGTFVRVISVWNPRPSETTPTIMEEWSVETDFALPRSWLSVAGILVLSIAHTPGRFFSAAMLALRTSRPGARGLLYQAAYFLEAVIVAHIARRHAIDHLHNHIGDQSGTVTMLAARIAGIGYSITFHGWPVFFDAKNARIKEKVLNAEFTRAISYFCRSQLMMFAECDDPTHFKVVHCGVHVEKYSYRPPREQVRRLFCAARLAPEKGLPFLLHAVKLLRERGHDLKLRLAGDGPSREALEHLALELGIAGKVQFLGYLSEDEVIDELKDTDIFVLPSFVEGVPVAAMEAMAVGVPVVATNIAGTGELVEDGVTGVLVRPSDAIALSKSVEKLLGDHPLRTAMAAKAREKVVDEFDVGIETAKLNGYLLRTAEPR